MFDGECRKPPIESRSKCLKTISVEVKRFVELDGDAFPLDVPGPGSEVWIAVFSTKAAVRRHDFIDIAE
jgi:hypothetical protein